MPGLVIMDGAIMAGTTGQPGHPCTGLKRCLMIMTTMATPVMVMEAILVMATVVIPAQVMAATPVMAMAVILALVMAVTPVMATAVILALVMADTPAAGVDPAGDGKVRSNQALFLEGFFSTT